MGWEYVDCMQEVPRIWGKFMETKNILLSHEQLKTEMIQWSKDTGWDINNSVYFPNNTIADLVNLCMSFGEAVRLG